NSQSDHADRFAACLDAVTLTILCPRVQDAPRPREGMLPPAAGSDIEHCLTNLQPVFADNGHNLLREVSSWRPTQTVPRSSSRSPPDRIWKCNKSALEN